MQTNANRNAAVSVRPANIGDIGTLIPLEGPEDGKQNKKDVW